jgi:hypothetical protein
MLVVVHIGSLHRFVLVPEMENAGNRQSQQQTNGEKHSIGRQSDEKDRDHGNRGNQACSSRKHTPQTTPECTPLKTVCLPRTKPKVKRPAKAGLSELKADSLSTDASPDSLPPVE